MDSSAANGYLTPNGRNSGLWRSKGISVGKRTPIWQAKSETWDQTNECNTSLWKQYPVPPNHVLSLGGVLIATDKVSLPCVLCSTCRLVSSADVSSAVRSSSQWSFVATAIATRKVKPKRREQTRTICKNKSVFKAVNWTILKSL